MFIHWSLERSISVGVSAVFVFVVVTLLRLDLVLVLEGLVLVLLLFPMVVNIDSGVLNGLFKEAEDSSICSGGGYDVGGGKFDSL